MFDLFSCPSCGEDVPASEYLRGVFQEDRYAEWMANLVTHWRHSHLGSYNASLQSSRYREMMWRGRPYEEVKAEINNRAKRQLMRSIARSRWPREEKRGLVDAVGRLQNNDPSTVAVRRTMLARLGGDTLPARVPQRARRSLEDWAEG